MNDKLAQIIHSIQNNATLLPVKKITAGFDGFVDTIVRIIRHKETNKQNILFETIQEFGAYINTKAGSSFSLELEEISTKLGGNMPITANALARLGIDVNCVGALGHPQTHKVFKDLIAICKCYSFADPGTATAYEFTDGKIMLAQMQALNELKWSDIKKTIGIETLIDLYRTSDLFCMLNWSEIDASTNIWKGILKDIMPHCKRNGEKQIVFVDLSDCSKRTNDSINEMLSLLKEFNTHAKAVLSLNKNECQRICEVLFGQQPANAEALSSELFQRLSVDTLLLHSSKKAITISKEGYIEANSFFVNDPVISTGAGDNFNAGFIAAQLMNLDAEASLVFANAVAAIYIRSGKSANMNEVLQFLNNQLN